LEVLWERAAGQYDYDPRLSPNDASSLYYKPHRYKAFEKRAQDVAG